jgi:hypothetical protein
VIRKIPANICLVLAGNHDFTQNWRGVPGVGHCGLENVCAKRDCSFSIDSKERVKYGLAHHVPHTVYSSEDMIDPVSFPNPFDGTFPETKDNLDENKSWLQLWSCRQSYHATNERYNILKTGSARPYLRSVASRPIVLEFFSINIFYIGTTLVMLTGH